MTDPVSDNLKKLIEIRKQKFKEYKTGNSDAANLTGGIIASFFPEGITLKTEKDFAKFSTFVFMICKMSRYANNFSEGHDDSLDDLSIYAQILKDQDIEK